MSSCFGLCGSEKKANKRDEFRVVYKKDEDKVVIETQTSDHEIPAEMPVTVTIVDCGSANLRAGYAGITSPLLTMPTAVSKSIVDDVTKKTFGVAALARSTECKISYPVERGLFKDWNDIEDLFEYVFDNQLRIKPKMNQLMLTEVPNNPTANREKTAEMIFEKFHFNSFLLVPSTPMGMYGYGSRTGIVVESGAGQTHIVAFNDFDYIRKSYRHIPLGGNDLTKYLGQLLTQHDKGRHFHGKNNDHEILNEIKHIGCHVVLNYDEEIKRSELNPALAQRNTILRDGTTVAMATESFQVPELLFQPEKIGIQTGGLPRNIYECIQSCDHNLREQLYKNICLCGGNTMFDGIEDRLLWEVKTYAGPDVDVKINALPERQNLVFLGSSLVSSFPTMDDYLITNKEYHEFGPKILQWKRF